MPSPDDKSSSLLIPNLLVLLLVGWGIYSTPAPLDSSRPEGATFDGVPERGMQQVEARLWQDPLAVTYAAIEKAGGGKRTGGEWEPPTIRGHPLTGIAQVYQNWKEKTPSGDTPLLFLTVYLPGSPYPQAVERRLRTRYAVISALANAGYQPHSSSNIGCTYYPPKPGQQPVWYLPFEEFVPFTSRSGHRQQSYTSVLVVYVNEKNLDGSPYNSTGKLLSHLYTSQPETRSPKVIHKILGPNSSDLLATMLKETLAAATAGREPLVPEQEVPVYAPMPTVAPSILRGLIHDAPIESDHITGGDLDFAIPDQGIRYLRTSSSDRELCTSLVAELRNRSVPTGDKRRPIALISEWDTLYGRTLPLAFEDAVKDSNSGDDSAIRTFSYLKGLDGRLPGDKEKTGNGGQSEGKSQEDYVRRLTRRLQDIERTGQTRFSAIGILGSDVYDKLILLRGMRKAFAHAIFFTTDLDAELLHPDQLPYTRNLIVASKYGFRLHERFQGNSPPFRDSYQTATYLSCLDALEFFDTTGHGEPGGEECLPLLSIPLSPVKLFEISRTGAFDLSISPSGKEPSKNIDPNPPGQRTQLPVFVWVLVAATLVLMSWLILVPIAKSVPVTKKLGSVIWFIILSAACSGFFFLAVAIALLNYRENEEPFALWEGISVWPSDLIRGIVIVLCLFYIWRSWFELFRDREQLKNELTSLLYPKGVLPTSATLPKLGELVTAVPNFMKRLKKRTVIHTRHLAENPKRWIPLNAQSWVGLTKTILSLGRHLTLAGLRGTSSVPEAWNRYERLSQHGRRAYRTIVICTIYFAVMTPLFFLYGEPLKPVRGPLSSDLHTLVLGFSLVALHVLLFFVVDANFICRALIDGVSNQLKTGSPPPHSTKSGKPSSIRG